jgi:hypothetical protein
MNESNTGATTNGAAKKPTFQNQHYDAIAELLGQKIVYGIMDENDYRIIEAFSEMFAQDNSTTFDKDRFKDAVYEALSRTLQKKSLHSLMIEWMILLCKQISYCECFSSPRSCQQKGDVETTMLEIQF